MKGLSAPLAFGWASPPGVARLAALLTDLLFA